MADSLQEVSNALAAAVQTAGPGVVRVDARRRLAATGIVWSEDGLIITANHVVRSDEDISVGLPDGESVSASLVGRDRSRDLALLQAEASGLNAAKRVWPDNLSVGHMALALGRPGRTVQATLGIVSALGDSWRTRAGGRLHHYLQTDVVMYPGFSGGPLVDASGQVLGLNSSHLLRGVSMTVPVPTLDEVAESLQTHGRMRRGFLGVGAQTVRLPDGLGETVGQETGLLLVSVDADSPAEQGGLLMGDTIVSLDGTPVRHLDDLLELLTSDRVGSEVPVKIVRGGEAQDLTVVIGERP